MTSSALRRGLPAVTGSAATHPSVPGEDGRSRPFERRVASRAPQSFSSSHTCIACDETFFVLAGHRVEHCARNLTRKTRSQRA